MLAGRFPEPRPYHGAGFCAIMPLSTTTNGGAHGRGAGARDRSRGNA
nr:MAG TPA: hypothetical protein [Caudoviricetes sp.]